MNIKHIISQFGGQTALAKLLGINQSAVAYWAKTGNIPSKWHARILDLARLIGLPMSAEDLIAPAVGGQVAPVSAVSTSQPIESEIVVGAGASVEAEAQLTSAQSQESPFLFYTADNGAIKVHVMLGDETVWATQKAMGEIFGVDVRTVSEHLLNIFKTEELKEDSVIRKFRTTASDGKKYDTNFYSLDAIISVGYRVNSYQATQFRRWATDVLKGYLIKGYALDDDRLKQGGRLFGKDYFDDLLEKIREIRASERRFYQKITDIYAQCSVDYDKNSPISQQFYAHVQDKLHFAIHGHTSAELIELRADATKPNMGLTSWKNEKVGGKVTKLDVTIGKNYLEKNEIDDLNRLVSMYLDWAENFARRQKVLTMKDWAEKLDGFLEFNAYDVLENYGRVRRDVAERHAVCEYEKFRVVQDRQYKSDFDRVVDDIKVKKKLPK